MGKQHEVETNVDKALTEFYCEASNPQQIVQNDQGVLVCPKVAKAGFVVGVEGGTCVMQIKGTTTEYYQTSSFKAGLLAGVESHSLLLVFNDAEALAKFREGKHNG